MIIELRILSSQHVFEYECVDIGKRESIFVHTKNEISFVDGKMDKHPESI